jgi:hypothetical protein
MARHVGRGGRPWTGLSGGGGWVGRWLEPSVVGCSGVGAFGDGGVLPREWSKRMGLKAGTILLPPRFLLKLRTDG